MGCRGRMASLMAALRKPTNTPARRPACKRCTWETDLHFPRPARLPSVAKLQAHSEDQRCPTTGTLPSRLPHYLPTALCPGPPDHCPGQHPCAQGYRHQTQLVEVQRNGRRRPKLLTTTKYRWIAGTCTSLLFLRGL